MNAQGGLSKVSAREPLPMSQALTTLREGRGLLVVVLDELEKRRDSPDDTEVLREMVGDLAAMISQWERERARWVA